jgi:hypothetical protein
VSTGIIVFIIEKNTRSSKFTGVKCIFTRPFPTPTTLDVGKDQSDRMEKKVVDERTRKNPIMRVRRRVPARAPPIPPITVAALIPPLAWAVSDGVCD